MVFSLYYQKTNEIKRIFKCFLHHFHSYEAISYSICSMYSKRDKVVSTFMLPSAQSTLLICPCLTINFLEVASQKAEWKKLMQLFMWIIVMVFGYTAVSNVYIFRFLIIFFNLVQSQGMALNVKFSVTSLYHFDWCSVKVFIVAISSCILVTLIFWFYYVFCRNQRMTEDQSVVGRRRIYYDQNGGETLICSDSDEEVLEEEEEKKVFAESEDYMLRLV